MLCFYEGPPDSPRFTRTDCPLEEGLDVGAVNGQLDNILIMVYSEPNISAT
jgi:hypothetical protein